MSQVDLSALRMQAPPTARPRRPLGPRLLGSATAALALAVAASFLWPLLWPARAVEMASVRTIEVAGGGAEGGGAVAEAVGWVEADPFAVAVRPLVEGRLESLEVLEGASVQAGVTVLARLASAPLQAAAERAAVRVTEADRALAVAATARELGLGGAQCELQVDGGGEQFFAQAHQLGGGAALAFEVRQFGCGAAARGVGGAFGLAGAFEGDRVAGARFLQALLGRVRGEGGAVVGGRARHGAAGGRDARV